VTGPRIAWGKGLNGRPDLHRPRNHLLVEKRCGPPDSALEAEIPRAYGPDPLRFARSGQIVNRGQFESGSPARWRGPGTGQILAGGSRAIPKALRIAPTLAGVDQCRRPLMADELFAALLAVLSVSPRLAAAIAPHQMTPPNPWALSVQPRPLGPRRPVAGTSREGSAFSTDVVMQVGVPRNCRFGRAWPSGHGQLPRQAASNTFSHHRSVLRRPSVSILPVRYRPTADRLG